MKWSELFKRIGSGLSTFFLIWMGLATIAPDVFQLKMGTLGFLSSILLYPKIGWVLLPFVGLWILWYLNHLDKRLSGFEAEFQQWLRNQQGNVQCEFEKQFNEMYSKTKNAWETAEKAIEEHLTLFERRLGFVELKIEEMRDRKGN